MARYDDLNTSAIAYTTFVSSILLVIIILLGRALCYAWIGGEDDRKLANAHYTSSDQMISKQKSAIDKFETVKVEVPPDAGADPNNPPAAVYEDRLHIPVSEAKKLLLQELTTGPKT